MRDEQRISLAERCGQISLFAPGLGFFFFALLSDSLSDSANMAWAGTLVLGGAGVVGIVCSLVGIAGALRLGRRNQAGLCVLGLLLSVGLLVMVRLYLREEHIILY